MDNVISEYQKWKQQGDSLRAQAKQAMETRFRDLLTEAVRIAQEYHQDFGSALKPPVTVTAFRYKAAAKKVSAVGGKPNKAAAVSKVVRAVPPAAVNPKIVALEKQLAQVRKKHEVAKAAGKPLKNLEDRIYEIEDDIRLANQPD